LVRRHRGAMGIATGGEAVAQGDARGGLEDVEGRGVRRDAARGGRVGGAGGGARMAQVGGVRRGAAAAAARACRLGQPARLRRAPAMVRDAPRAVRAERTPTLAVAPNLNPSPNPNSDPEPLTRALTSTLPPATRLNAVWLMRRVVGFWGRRMLGTCYRQWKSTTLEGHATQQRGRRAVALWQGRNAAAALARLSYACAAQAAAHA
jgi:hypothetical protein